MKIFRFALIIFFIAIFFHFYISLPSFAQDTSASTIMEAVVNSVHETHTSGRTIKNVNLTIISGNLNGRRVTFQDNTLSTSYTLTYKTGDHVIVTYSKDPAGKEFFYITDYDRKPALLILGGLFLVLILIVAQKQGLASLAGMVISFFFIIKFIIPPILDGNNPLTVTLLISFFIIPITYYLAHGLNKKTTVAIGATIITLILVGLLAYFFSLMAKLTGFATEEATYLQSLKGNINIQSILLSGIIIGGLAVLNDVTISQASTVASLYKSNPKLSFGELYSHAMDVGRDHISSLVNTLILVYAGASLPLFLLFYHSTVGLPLLVNQEVIATEIVRTLVTSIGIVAAVPISTYLACLFVKK